MDVVRLESALLNWHRVEPVFPSRPFPVAEERLAQGGSPRRVQKEAAASPSFLLFLSSSPSPHDQRRPLLSGAANPNPSSGRSQRPAPNQLGHHFIVAADLDPDRGSPLRGVASRRSISPFLALDGVSVAGRREVRRHSRPCPGRTETPILLRTHQAAVNPAKQHDGTRFSQKQPKKKQ